MPRSVCTTFMFYLLTFSATFLFLSCPSPPHQPTQWQVNVTVDYIRAATGPAEGTPAFSERTCATVTIGGV